MHSGKEFEEAHKICIDIDLKNEKCIHFVFARLMICVIIFLKSRIGFCAVACKPHSERLNQKTWIVSLMSKMAFP